MREEDEQKRNMIIFFAITMLIMIGYPYIFRDNENTSILQQNVVQTQIDPNLVVLEESQEENNKVETITIDSNRLSGHISTQGALFNDIILKDGVYAYCQGPMYETPAEIRALKVLGADFEAPNVSSALTANPSIADLSKGGES